MNTATFRLIISSTFYTHTPLRVSCYKVSKFRINLSTEKTILSHDKREMTC